MKRSELREHTFNLLFHVDFYKTQEEIEEQISLYFKLSEAGEQEKSVWWRADDEDFLDLKPQDVPIVEERVRAVIKELPQIDEKLAEKAVDWKLNRMNKVDLTILRLALYEIQYDASVPERVAINEAVELAKKFGGDHSSKFVNGILAKFAS